MMNRVAEAWHWWFREFQTLIPKKYFAPFSKARSNLLVRASPDRTALTVTHEHAVLFQDCLDFPYQDEDRVRRVMKEIRAVSKKRKLSVVALISNTHVLERTVTLPLAAETHLREALNYQIDKLSPFPPGNTIYDVQSLTRGEASQGVCVRLRMVSKSVIEELEHRVEGLGVSVDRFAIEAPGRASFDDVAFRSEVRPQSSMDFSTKALLAASALLLCTIVVVPILSRMNALEHFDREIAALKPKAEQMLKARTERDKILALRLEVIGLRRSSQPPLPVLSKLSDAFDDGSYLFDYRADAGSITVSGISVDASKLLQRLSAVPDFKSVRFSGPVTRDAQSALERFTLVLEIGAPPS